MTGVLRKGEFGLGDGCAQRGGGGDTQGMWTQRQGWSAGATRGQEGRKDLCPEPSEAPVSSISA